MGRPRNTSEIKTENERQADLLRREFERQTRHQENKAHKQAIGLVRAERRAERLRELGRKSPITPTVAAMLDSAYQSLAMQFHLHRQEAHLEVWNSQMSSGFAKNVQSLSLLQEIERKALEGVDLSSVTSDKLEALAAQAKNIISEG